MLAAALVVSVAALGGRAADATAATSQLTFTPAVDTYVSAAAPTSAFGTAADLRVRSGTSAYTTYLRPALSGSALEGQTLTAAPGTWAGDPAPALAYKWRRCDAAGGACVDIPGAVESMYQVAFGDVGRTLRARVTAANSAGSAFADSAPTAVVQPASLSFPVRAGFYYGWYPENWVPGMNYTPSLGLYDSSDTAVIKKHIASMQYAGMQAGIYSWWGRQNTGNSTAARFPLYLDAANGTGFKWAVYYEPEGYGNPTSAELQSDLSYIRDTYASSPSYLRVGGRPVVFAYSGAGDGCGMAARWKAASSVGAYVVLSNPWVDNSPQLSAVTPYATKPGIRVAAGDLTGDGKAEIVTAPSGGATTIRVYSGSGTQLTSFQAGDPAQTPGAFVAVGDVSGDGRADIVVGSGASPTPWIRAYSYNAGVVTELGAVTPAITTGVRVAVGDLTGDGIGDVIAVSGPGPAPVLQVFRGGDGANLGTFPVDPSYAKGLTVAAADLAGDARAEIVVGVANGTTNTVAVIDANGVVTRSFTAYPGFGGAISVAVGDVNGDGGPDIVTGASGGPHVRAFTLRLGQPSGLVSFFSEAPTSTGQVWVASGDAAGEGTADIVTGAPAGQSGQAKVFGNVRDCPDQPDGWHEYLVTASGESAFGGDSFTVAPGYWWADDAAPALPRDPDRWAANVSRMAASGADWQLVLSFNEWGEATSTESATGWASSSGEGVYADILRANGAAAMRADGAAPASSSPTGSGPLALRAPLGPDKRVNEPRAGKHEKPTAPAAEFPFGHRGTVDRNGHSRKP